MNVDMVEPKKAITSKTAIAVLSSGVILRILDHGRLRDDRGAMMKIRCDRSGGPGECVIISGGSKQNNEGTREREEGRKEGRKEGLQCRCVASPDRRCSFLHR